MNRRAILGTLASSGIAVGIGGCLGDGDSNQEGDGDTDSPAESNGSAPPAPATTVTVGDYESTVERSGQQLEFSVDITDPAFGATNPPTIEVSVQNTEDDTLSLLTGHRNVLSTHRDESEQLYLLDAGRGYEDQAPDLPCPMRIDTVNIQGISHAVELVAGASATDELTLWADFDALDGICPEADTYTFTETVRLNTEEGGTDVFDWSLPLELE
jgi:hypothetical protein